MTSQSSFDLDNIETDELFITTVIDSVSIPAYGILSQCQLRCRKLEELIEYHEKQLQSIEHTESIEKHEESENNTTNVIEDKHEDNDESIFEDDKTSEKDNKDKTSKNQADGPRIEVRTYT